MSLYLNLGDINLTFRIKSYHKPRKSTWDEEWCKISLSLRSRDWLIYKIVDDEILLCCEIDALAQQLEAVRNHKQSEKRTLSFIEPDFNFTFYPSVDNRTPMINWIVNFWTDRKSLSANYLSLQLDMMDISNLLNYLHHIQSETDKKYEPVTGDGLTEKQLAETLQKSIEEAKTGKGFPLDEVMKSLKNNIENNYKIIIPPATLTLDFSRNHMEMTISKSTFDTLSIPSEFNLFYNRERQTMVVVDKKISSAGLGECCVPFTVPRDNFKYVDDVFLHELLNTILGLEIDKSYLINGTYRAYNHTIVFPLSDYQLIEEN